jgi:uncharacterized protein (TIGR03086 family)
VSEIADRYRRLAAGFTERVEVVPADRWDSPSPCTEWTARDVVGHMAGNADLFFGLVGRERPAGPSVADDPLGAWIAARDAIQGGLDDPAVATVEYEGQLGRSTFEQGIDRFVSADTLVHTWDLARATGLDDRLDPDEVHTVYESLAPMGDVLRSSGAFGAEVEAPEGADGQTRLLAFLGRRA